MIASGATELCGSSPSRRATSLEGSEPIAWPSRTTVPARGLSMRASPRSSVDLPHALGPTMAVNEASGIATSSASETTRPVVGERETVALQAAHAPPLPDQQPAQVDAAEHAGQHAHRELDVAGDPLARAVGAEQQHRRPSARRRRRPGRWRA